MRCLVLPVACILGCTRTASPRENDPRPGASGSPVMTALPRTAVPRPPSAESMPPAPASKRPPTEQPGTARCEWAKPKPGTSVPSIELVQQQIDVVRLANGLPPLTDAERKASAERARIDDALMGTIGCEVSRVRGELPPSDFAFAVDDALPEVARCLHQPGHARTGKLVVRLAFDEAGQPQSARLELSKLDQATTTCVERAFTEVRPADHQGDPKTGQPLTDEAQANASAVVELDLKMPAIR